MDQVTGIKFLNSQDRVAATDITVTTQVYQQQQHQPPHYSIECHLHVAKMEAITMIYRAISTMRLVVFTIFVR